MTHQRRRSLPYQPYLGYLRKKFEPSVLQHIDAHVVCPQVVDLLLEDAAPKVFAEEFHDLELIFESRRVFCETFDQTLAHLKAQVFELCDTKFLSRMNLVIDD